MLLEGLHIPLTTPFHQDGRLNPYKLAANVLRYSKSPAAGLVALAPCAGEPTLLTDSETHQALSAIAEVAAPEKVLTAHISRDSVRATVALAEVAAELLYDAVAIARPAALGQISTAELLTYFQTIADRSPLPVILVATSHGPYALTPQLLSTLGVHPNVLGAIWDFTTDLEGSGSEQGSPIAEVLRNLAGVQREVTVTPTFAAVTRRMQRIAAKSSPSPSLNQASLVSATALARNPAAAATAIIDPPAAPPLRSRSKKVGFQLITVACRQFVSDLDNGAVGIAPAFAACAPQACYEVFAAWKDGDQALALQKQERIRPAAEYVDRWGTAAVKFGCDLNGYSGGAPRSPHLPLTAERRNELQQHMSSLRT